VPCLVWESPEGRFVHELDRAVLVIGREEVSDIVILEPAVSRRHALLQVDGERVTVTDLGSSSGTRINGAQLMPDLPSSLEPGDFIQLGRVTLTYHLAAPLQLAPAPPETSAAVPPAPSVAAAPAPTKVARAAAVRTTPAAHPKPRPKIARPPAARGGGDGGTRWKWFAGGAAFLAVGLGGALVAVLVMRGDGDADGGDPGAQKQAETAREPNPIEKPSPAPPPTGETPPKTEPAPEPKPDLNRAPAGELPPRGFVSVTDYPDLLELNGESHYPVRVRTWNALRLEAVGADGRTYTIRQAEVTKSEDRMDLARRAARARQQLDPDDADAQLELARWCAHRYIKRETRLLAERVIELRPGDAEATELLRITE